MGRHGKASAAIVAAGTIAAVAALATATADDRHVGRAALAARRHARAVLALAGLAPSRERG